MIIKYILSFLIKNDYISILDYDIYQYGLKSIILNLSTILSVIIVSSCFNCILFSLFFLISFIPIRINLGGYHCKTPIRCLLSFNIIYFIHYFLLFHIQNYSFIFVVIIIMTSILLWVNPYKSIQKCNVYLISRKNFYILLNLICVLLFNYNILTKAVLVSLLMNVLLYFTAKIQHYFKYKNSLKQIF